MSDSIFQGTHSAVPGDFGPPQPLLPLPDDSSPQLGMLMQKVEGYFARFGRPEDGSRILVALSGGPDSIALLSVMQRLAKESRWTLDAAHVNYGLRGMESHEDEAFCRELCLRWGAGFYCRRIDAAGCPSGANLQSWARDIRYEFFEATADLHSHDRIAVGHHLGDRAETVAAAVLDAAGSFALSGIPPVRGRIIRPLYDCHPHIIREYLRIQGIPFRIDRSNDAVVYRRNRIRLHTLPEWSEENPRIVEGLARLGEQLWHQQAYLEKEADRHLQQGLIWSETDRIILDGDRMSCYDSCLDPFVLRLLIRQIGLRMVPSQATVERFSGLCRQNGSRRAEQGDLILERSKGQIAVMRRIPGPVGQPGETPVAAGLVTQFHDWRLALALVDGAGCGPHDDRCEAFLDADRLREPLVVRKAQPGDRYRPVGLHGTKKLHDLLADRAVPVFERGRIPILSDQEGILWPVGHPIAERARITDGTRRILRAGATRT